jgi:hypothetical protein
MPTACPDRGCPCRTTGVFSADRHDGCLAAVAPGDIYPGVLDRFRPDRLPGVRRGEGAMETASRRRVDQSG